MVVLTILTLISVTMYTGVMRNTAETATQSALDHGTDALRLYDTKGHIYPGNIADTGYAPADGVGIALYTNTDQIPVYENLTSDENAQLFLNSCNAAMPITSGSTTYNTACSYNGGGKHLHVSGQAGSNLVIDTPLSQGNFVLSCGSACSAAQATIISDFIAQGGTFPIIGSKSGTPLPAPTLTSIGNASRFCFEARSVNYSDIVYHTTSENAQIVKGACPADPELHYP